MFWRGQNENKSMNNASTMTCGVLDLIGITRMNLVMSQVAARRYLEF